LESLALRAVVRLAMRAVQMAGMIRAGVLLAALVFATVWLRALWFPGRMAKEPASGEVHRLPPPAGGT
jgi:hypothetical protein